MTNLPSDPTTLCVNAEKLYLQTGSNPDTYTTLQDVVFHLERPELREPITGLGVTNASGTVITAIYFYGPGDNWLEATLLMSLAEYTTFATSSFYRTSSGAMPTTQFRLLVTNFSGTSVVIGNKPVSTELGFKGVIVSNTLDKPPIGGVKMTIRIRLLEDQITVA